MGMTRFPVSLSVRTALRSPLSSCAIAQVENNAPWAQSACVTETQARHLVAGLRRPRPAHTQRSTVIVLMNLIGE